MKSTFVTSGHQNQILFDESRISLSKSDELKTLAIMAETISDLGFATHLCCITNATSNTSQIECKNAYFKKTKHYSIRTSGISILLVACNDRYSERSKIKNKIFTGHTDISFSIERSNESSKKSQKNHLIVFMLHKKIDDATSIYPIKWNCKYIYQSLFISITNQICTSNINSQHISLFIEGLSISLAKGSGLVSARDIYRHIVENLQEMHQRPYFQTNTSN